MTTSPAYISMKTSRDADEASDHLQRRRFLPLQSRPYPLTKQCRGYLRDSLLKQATTKNQGWSHRRRKATLTASGTCCPSSKHYETLAAADGVVSAGFNVMYL